MLFRNYKFFWLVLVVFVGCGVFYQIVQAGGKVVKLASAPSFSGSIAQSLYKGSDQINLPNANGDFTLKNTQYFDSNQWVVTTVRSTNNSFDGGVVILKKDGSLYKVVAGPSSQYGLSYTYVLPAEVAQALSNLGVLSGSP